MDDAFTVKTDAVVYIDRGTIVAVQDRAQPAPAGFDGVAPGRDRRNAFPGLDRTAQSSQPTTRCRCGARYRSCSSTAANGPTTPTTASSSAVP